MEIQELIEGTLADYRNRLETALAGLTTEELAWRPDHHSNSIGFMLWHLARVEDRWIVRDHRVATCGRRKSWCSVSLAPGAFSSGFGLTSPVYNVHQPDSIVCRLETSWNRGLSPPPPSGRFPLPPRTGNRSHLLCKLICAPCAMNWVSSATT